MTPEGPPEPRRPRVRVAAIPDTGDYVDAVLPPEAVRVGPAREPSPWLDAAYLTEHVAEVDVLHVHAGCAALPAAGLECWSETVRRLGIPLVVTVHQLRDASTGRPDAALPPLLATAEVVLTLTPGAADDIADRFGRTAIVVAHPTVAAPLPDLGGERGLVGLVLGAGSPADGAGDGHTAALVRAALSGAVSGGGRLRVLAGPGPDLTALRALAAEHGFELLAEPASAADRLAQLQRLHVAVLPERCRTHSRDLEICRDVGTRVVVPSCGWFADQWSDVVSYADGDGGFDPVSLTAAVAAALARPAPRPADRTWRDEQRVAVQRVHAQVYEQVIGDRSWT